MATKCLIRANFNQIIGCCNQTFLSVYVLTSVARFLSVNSTNMYLVLCYKFNVILELNWVVVDVYVVMLGLSNRRWKLIFFLKIELNRNRFFGWYFFDFDSRLYWRRQRTAASSKHDSWAVAKSAEYAALITRIACRSVARCGRHGRFKVSCSYPTHPCITDPISPLPFLCYVGGWPHAPDIYIPEYYRSMCS